MVEIRHMTETGHIVETGTAPENTKETGHIVEIDCKAITDNLKTRDMREGLNTIVKTNTARIFIEIMTKAKINTKAKQVQK